MAYQVDAGSNVYTVVNDTTTYYWAIIQGAASDEIFGTMNAPAFAVEVLSRSDLGTKVLPNGLYAITGYPSLSFPHLSTTAYTVTYVLSAPGYLDVTLPVIIPINATFPVSAPATAMRRLPIRIQGCVLSASSGLPLGNVLVTSIDNPSSPPTVHTTALRAPLYFAHGLGAAVQTATILTPGATSLTQDATGGNQVLNLLSLVGIAVGSIVQLSYLGGVRLEYAFVSALGPGPGQVTLSAPLNYSYPAAGASVNFGTATASGAAATLSVDANVGDGVVLASKLFSQAVIVDSGTPVQEVHAVGALTGSDGYYGLDGIGRVQQIFLQANTLSNPIVDWYLEFDQPFNEVDFRA